MKITTRTLRSSSALIVGVFMLASSAATMGSDEARKSRSYALDNDALINSRRDKDYSFGFNMTFRGQGVEDQWASLHQPLDWLDRAIRLDQFAQISPNSAQIEYGFYAFTPDELSESEPIHDDRPYASLIFISSSHGRYQETGEVSWQSSLTVGILGLDITGDIQEGVHSLTDSTKPRGWDNQISDGGEPTARYSLARQQLLYKNGSTLEIKASTQGSVGYLTEASWGMTLRAGSIHTPWYSFNPELTSYGERSIPTDLGKADEHYFWAGFALTARAYNVFLQGQFRDSEVTYDSGDTNLGIAKAWAGYTHVFDSGYSLSYSLRGQTSELKNGDGDRSSYWASLSLTKFFY